MNYFKLIYHKARMRWNQVVANSIAEGGGLSHEERMKIDDKYYNAYRNYKQSKKIVEDMGGFKKRGNA